MVFRVYVEKKSQFDGASRHTLTELQNTLGLKSLTELRTLVRYDVEGIDEPLFKRAITCVFSEPQTDIATLRRPSSHGWHVFATEMLPGQFDQRADSASECIQLLSQGQRPRVRAAKLYYLKGDLTEAEFAAIKSYLINPIESREADLAKPKRLEQSIPAPEPVAILKGFRSWTKAECKKNLASFGLAMDLADLLFCQDYFKTLGRDCSIAELRLIDTYWSDHCRHTTFGTELTKVQIDDAVVKKAFERYLELRKELGREQKTSCLMDMATLGARYLKHTGDLKNLDESEEINACTVKVVVDNNGVDEDWLFLFKNETHNHPTEIEPFGGAATCIGGAIRDPLSGRAYVYQAMRVTGAADPRTSFSKTLAGKLPQRKICLGAADGYSSYGNQIGLATGQVAELYHPSYVAKRMEIGAVVAAAPASHVRRETPAPGDVVVLLGGRTGRDGIGGATGSSKAHTEKSLTKDGAEVQKGNAPTERKLQRLFRRKDACELIKRCNDFGAGGVGVAIGELADGLAINLDLVPKKYEGLDGTELAISESQERMAVVLAAKDLKRFLKIATEENLEATQVATVTKEPVLSMTWQNTEIIHLDRSFLNSNGAPKAQDIHVEKQGSYQLKVKGKSLQEKLSALASDINVASNKGLSERFDSTIGAATVLMPFGGKEQLTAPMAMVSKLPVFGETTTVSGMSFGGNPYLLEANQYEGAYLAVVESVSKMIAAGFKKEDLYLTFQEYFERLGDNPKRWGKPTAALLGALMAQLDLKIAAIGGKDSMSGSFEKIDVPPTLISFATGLGKLDSVLSPEFKATGHKIWLFSPRYKKESLIPELDSLTDLYRYLEKLNSNKDICSLATASYGGVAEQLLKMSFGNQLGFTLEPTVDLDQLFSLAYGSFIVEAPAETYIELEQNFDIQLLGWTSNEFKVFAPDATFDLAPIQELWESALESVYPYREKGETFEPVSSTVEPKRLKTLGLKLEKPKVVIPVFPGNNCEFDSAEAFERVGAEVETLIINNLSADAVKQSAKQLADAIKKAQIVMIPGGFSGGDEPDGSAKFITSFFRAPEVTEAVHVLLNKNDGLMLGICNGFQALIKLGLVPFGEIRDMDEHCPTLTHNKIGRHQSRLVTTRVASTLSPWLANCSVGDEHSIAISHGEGRFVCEDALLEKLIAAGQVCTQYVGADSMCSSDLSVNPNGSDLAIEGICSPDGRIFGKMGHSERSGKGLYQNVNVAAKYQPLFEAGVAYFN